MAGSEIIEKALREGRNTLTEYEAKLFCREHGIPVTEIRLAKNEDEAVEYAKEIGFPVVLKIISPEIVHKSDVGGVAINLRSEEEVRQAYRRVVENARKAVPNATIYGVSVQEMVEPSLEVAVGLIRDAQFGPCVMFGLGGVFIEVLRDVTFRVCPIDVRDALEMVEEIRGKQLLEGYRGLPPADKEALAKVLVRVSEVGIEHPEISEMDLNPTTVRGSSIKVVDARIIVSPQ